MTTRGPSSRSGAGHRPGVKVFLQTLGVSTLCGSLAACGSGNAQSGSLLRTGGAATTKVTVMLSSTANDQLSGYYVQLQTLTLTSASGNTLALIGQPQSTEFVHVNGGSEPLVTDSIPSDRYVTATATVGAAQFGCIGLETDGSSPGALVESTYAYGNTPSSNVTVRIPAPLEVSGSSLALSLDLLVSLSASYGDCVGGASAYTISPTFSLALPAGTG